MAPVIGLNQKSKIVKLMRIRLQIAAIRRTSPGHPTPTTPAVAEKTVQQQQQLPVKSK